MSETELIKLLGAIAGLAAFVWRLFDEFGSYLRISVKAESPKNGWVTILTTIDNKGNRPKNLSYACLLLGPESEPPLDSARFVAKEIGYKGDLRYTNHIGNLHSEEPVYADGRVLVPLRFFYSENIQIGDETVTYRTPIDAHQLKPGVPYSGRLLVFPKRRLHRTTQDCCLTDEGG